MKLSEIENMFDKYRSAKYSPDRMDIFLGCECGCGDEYTAESYQEELEIADHAINAMKKLCVDLNIEYDGID